MELSFSGDSGLTFFMILKAHLTELQIFQIKNHIEVAKELEKKGRLEKMIYDNPWMITEEKTWVSGKVQIDDFDMSEFLNIIRVNPNHIRWQ
jgi:hypothetical protein